MNNVIRKLLSAGLIASPTLPANLAAEVKRDIPDPLSRDMRIALTGRSHEYLKKLALHNYEGHPHSPCWACNPYS
jgi:hypothetical protein